MNIDKEKNIKNFKCEVQRKLVSMSFNLTDDYKIKISNIIAETFVSYVLGIYEGIYDGFDIKAVELNNNILFKIQSLEKILLADILLSVSKANNKLTITNILTNIKQL